MWTLQRPPLHTVLTSKQSPQRKQLTSTISSNTASVRRPRHSLHHKRTLLATLRLQRLRSTMPCQYFPSQPITLESQPRYYKHYRIYPRLYLSRSVTNNILGPHPLSRTMSGNNYTHKSTSGTSSRSTSGSTISYATCNGCDCQGGSSWDSKGGMKYENKSGKYCTPDYTLGRPKSSERLRKQ